MNRRRFIGVFALAASLLVLPVCRGDDAADALKSKDLVKSGTTYVLPVEQELADAMKDLRKLKVKLDQQQKQRRGSGSKAEVLQGRHLRPRS